MISAGGGWRARVPSSGGAGRNEIIERLVQLLFFVPGAAIVATLVPTDMPKSVQFRQEARQRVPVVFLYSICFYALLLWLVLAVRAVPHFVASIPSAPAPASAPPSLPQPTAPAPPRVAPEPRIASAPAAAPPSPATAQSPIPAKNAVSPTAQRPSAGAPIPLAPPSPAIVGLNPVVPSQQADRCAALNGNERLICASTELATQDTEAKRLVDALRAHLPATDRDTLNVRIASWLAQREKRCSASLAEDTGTNCLKAFYVEYLSTLQQSVPAGIAQGKLPQHAELSTSLWALRSIIESNLDYATAGKPIPWADATTGTHGFVTFEIGQPNRQGNVCRRYSYTVENAVSAPSAVQLGSACRVAVGHWQHISGQFAQAGP